MTEFSGDPRTAELAERLEAVRRRLDAAVAAANRPAGSCELLVVTKFFPADDVCRLLGLGERAFGESREPEAGRKVAEVRAEWTPADPADAPVFDMIGSVQSKKAGSVARWARAVHSVDRPKVADALDRAAASALDEGHRTDPLGVLLQVSLDGDPLRGGVVEEDLLALAERVSAAEALRLRGLMVIAPLEGEREHWMAEAARIHRAFVERFADAVELSAGMSGDMEVAVAAGSTCVRVGTAIMGDRPLVSQ
ncbi:YggS family pyridoxal phosphate-dependent enzyme [Gordonia sp. zg691]|uniref:YggS family pyridoxal phosphate-dependent enzyme n=1 Tax=Gordonia jinghuaiqii TaxID=2758710 RepID=UPI00166276AB|nr:YggS family pyridoxal phosphate-dependent enzyme [Gordonia jinghuaiqii]MBD0860095.1 YggS family pyridoxal phosphate-dependent enzyme [Gordonia jinghuaiqii]